MRIGASPINNIPTCCADCGQPLERGMHCIGGCNRISVSLGRQRHDRVVNALNSILRADAGVNTVLEPMARGPVGRGDSRRRQDLLLANPGSAE